MLTNEDRTQRICARAAELKQIRIKRKRRAMNAACVGLCLMLVVAIGIAMPGLVEGHRTGEVSLTTGAASLLTTNSAVGYILMGLLCFLMGICVTLLLDRIKKGREVEAREEPKDEL